MRSKKTTPRLTKKLAESASILFSALLVFSAIVYAATSWTPGTAPLSAPGDGNVVTDSSWAKNGPDKIFYSGGNVGIGTNDPSAKLEVSGNIIADSPTADNHIATKSYVDAAGGGSTAIDAETIPCDADHDLMFGVNRSTGTWLFCDYDGGTGGGWRSVRTTAFTSNFPAGSSHDETDCTIAGGEVVAIDTHTSICRFNASSCPSGWSNYNNYMTVSGSYGPTTGNTTGYPSCSPSAYYQGFNNGCDPSNSWGPGNSSQCTYYSCTWSCYHLWDSGRSVCNSQSRYGTITQIGCY